MLSHQTLAWPSDTGLAIRHLLGPPSDTGLTIRHWLGHLTLAGAIRLCAQPSDTCSAIRHWLDHQTLVWPSGTGLTIRHWLGHQTPAETTIRHWLGHQTLAWPCSLLLCSQQPRSNKPFTSYGRQCSYDTPHLPAFISRVGAAVVYCHTPFMWLWPCQASRMLGKYSSN